VRISANEFEAALMSLEDGHSRSAGDKINLNAAIYFKSVEKVNLDWWKEWHKSPHDNAKSLLISRHELTKFAAVISAIEREKAVAVVDGYALQESRLANAIRTNTYVDWWPSYFPIEGDAE
jgi:hypothetical protein